MKTTQEFYKNYSNEAKGILCTKFNTKEFYIKHIDEMEEYKENIEGCMGGPTQNRIRAPHYTFMCCTAIK
jgi:hypothetical protein